MFTIGDNVSALINIGDVEVTATMFDKLVMQDQVGGTLPLMQLTLVQKTFAMYSVLDTSPIIDIKIGNSRDTQFKAKYKVKDFNYDGNKLVITALIDLPKHMEVDQQKSYNDTLSNIFTKLLTTIPVTMDVETNDKQIWIRDGSQSEWDFVNDCVMHGWVSEKDALLHAYTMDGNLIISSIEGVLGRKEYITLSNTKNPSNDQNQYRYHTIKPESNKAMWDKSLVRRQLPVFHIVGRKVVSYKNKDLENAKDLIHLPQLTDCGNCHENYYQAQMNYISKVAQLSYNSFYLYPNHFIDISRIKLLDKVMISNPKDAKLQALDPMNGSYIVAGRSVAFSIDTNQIRYNLVRPGFGAKDTGDDNAN